MTAAVLGRALGLSMALALIWSGFASLRHRPAGGAPRWIAAVSLRLGWMTARCAPIRRRGRDAECRRDAAVAATHWTARWSGAGVDLDHSGLRIAGLRLLLGGAGLTALAATFVAAPALLLLAAPLPGVAFMVPDLALSQAATASRRGADAELPLVLELLAFRLCAGAELGNAIRQCVAPATGALRVTLQRAAWFAGCGATPAAALDMAAETSGLAGLRRAAVTIRRGHSLGLPLAPPLRALAAELEDATLNAERVRAARATPVATLLTALVVAPACIAALGLCVIGGAIAASPILH